MNFIVDATHISTMAEDKGFCTCDAVNHWLSSHKADCKCNELCTCGGVEDRSYDFVDVEHKFDCLSKCKSLSEIVEKHKELLEDYKKSQKKLKSIMKIVAKIGQND